VDEVEHGPKKTDLDRLNARDEEVLPSSTDYVLHQEVDVLLRVAWDEPRNGAEGITRLTDDGAC